MALVHGRILGGLSAGASRSSDSLSDRSAKIEHPVEHLDADTGLRPLGSQASRTQTPTDDPLVARHASLDQVAPRVAGSPSPSPFAVGLKIGDVAVPLLDEVELPGAHAIGAPWWHDYLGDRQLLSAADQQVVGRLPVKGATGQETVNATVDLIHHLRQDRGSGPTPGGQFGGDELPRAGAHAQMELAPGAALGGRLGIASLAARFDL